MEHILTTLNVVLPVFAVIAIGYLFKRKGVIDEVFVGKAMKIIFNVSLPSLLFLKISQADISILFNDDSLFFGGFAVVLTLLVFFSAILIARYTIADPASRGTFVQGAFRSNYIIIGYAVLYNLFGDAIIGRMAILLITIIPLYNVLAVMILSQNTSGSRKDSIRNMVKKIISNPLIIASILGFVFSLNSWGIPELIGDTMTLVGSIGTPLGLIGIGAYLNFSEIGTMKDALKVTILKVMINPALAIILGLIFGFTYVDVAILFVLFGSPAAISSFIMATALGGNSKLAANIVILTTTMSLFTYVIGLTILNFIFL